MKSKSWTHEHLGLDPMVTLQAQLEGAKQDRRAAERALEEMAEALAAERMEMEKIVKARVSVEVEGQIKQRIDKAVVKAVLAERTRLHKQLYGFANDLVNGKPLRKRS